MATRPVFVINQDIPHFREDNISFIYYSGFADSQRKKSFQSLHHEYLAIHPAAKILEVSRFSDSYLGQKLSAFNLIGETSSGKKRPVENLFQSSKVFENGGPFRDLLNVTPMAAKKDERLKSSGNLVGFNLDGESFPLIPKTFFYDWIYINALKGNPDIMNELLQFNAFTDIVFNPQKSINCQARTIAVFVSICNAGILEKCLDSKEQFAMLVYGDTLGQEQMCLF